MVMPLGITKTIDEAEVYVSSLLSLFLSENVVFHNLHHTWEVVKMTFEICRYLKLPPQEEEIVMLAAWFHDCGHIAGAEGHEKTSIRIAQHFLKERNWKAHRIKQVENCILATQMPQQPKNLLEKIICDADLHHLADDNYLDYLKRLRQEWELVLHIKETDEAWILINLEFLAEQEYFTTYGQKILQPKLDMNIKRLLDKL